MINVNVLSSDTRIKDVDYIFEDCKKLWVLVPYLLRKIEGDWRIACVDTKIGEVREMLDSRLIPDYVIIDVYVDKQVMDKLLTERPDLQIKEKTAYERYLDFIGDMKVLIKPDAARELYRRVGNSKDKLKDYLTELSENADTITIADVRKRVVDERKIYASNIVDSFYRKDRWRWNRLDKYIQDLGRNYAFYAVRKYTQKLVQDKDAYLHNHDTKIRNIGTIDALSINLLYTLFNTSTPKELELCFLCWENRDYARRII